MEGKNWEMSKVRVLVDLPFDHPDWIICVSCYGTLNTNNFYFIFFYFFWFYFSFSFSLFYFPGETMKKARDKEVTWQVTWCDVIGLEYSRRVWKMMSGHLEYTWWPWVRSEEDMRMKHGHKGRVIYW